MDDRFTDETDANVAPPAPVSSAPDGFWAVTDLLHCVADLKTFKTRLRELKKETDAAARAKAEAIAERTALDAYTASERVTLDAERATVAQRRLAVHSAEGKLAERERRISNLEKAWHDLGEPPDVVRGLRDPEHTALEKARRAHGIEDEPRAVVIEDDPREDGDPRTGFGGDKFSATTTITRDVRRRGLRRVAEA